MKKTLLMIALVSAVAVANAQDMMSKKGTPILPESGDWSIGVSVNPFFDYFGNMFNGSTGNSSPSWDFTNSSQVITGKLMKDETTAYRAKVRLGFGSSSTETGDTANGQLNKTSLSNMNVTLGAGLQMYRGKGRLQGFYGAEALIGFGSGKTTYDYNNGTTSAFAPTETNNGSTFNFGVRGFIGAEYFFAPKISISGEFGWGIGFSSTGANETTYGDGHVDTNVGKSSSFGLDTDNSGGSINMSFYF